MEDLGENVVSDHYKASITIHVNTFSTMFLTFARSQIAKTASLICWPF